LALEWPQQPDGTSCGLLTIAAICCAVQGIKPCASSLGIPLIEGTPMWTSKNSLALRSSIFGFLTAYTASEPSSETRWDLSTVKDSEFFVQSLRPWMPTKDELDSMFDR
jgi:hypothetical protein